MGHALLFLQPRERAYIARIEQIRWEDFHTLLSGFNKNKIAAQRAAQNARTKRKEKVSVKRKRVPHQNITGQFSNHQGPVQRWHRNHARVRTHS